MNKIIFSNKPDKDKILNEFNKAKTKTLQQKKDNYAGKLTSFRKSSLETEKADLEYSIENEKIFAAFSTVFGLFVFKQILQWLPINSMLKLNGEYLVVSLFSTLSAWLLLRVGEKVSCLHVIKLALARKSDK